MKSDVQKDIMVEAVEGMKYSLNVFAAAASFSLILLIAYGAFQ